MMKCPLCNQTLLRKEIQSRSDDEASALVLICPIHGHSYSLIHQYMQFRDSNQSKKDRDRMESEGVKSYSDIERPYDQPQNLQIPHKIMLSHQNVEDAV